MRASSEEKREVLDSVSLEERFEKAFPLLERQIEGLQRAGRKGEKVSEGKVKIRDAWDEVGEEAADEMQELETRLR